MLMQGLPVPDPPISSAQPLLPAQQLPHTPPRPDHGVAIDEPEISPLPIPDEPSTSGVNVSSSGKHRMDNLILTVHLIEK